MGRRVEPVPLASLDPALEYLQRAIERKAPLFSKPLSSTKSTLAALRNKAENLRPLEYGEVANEWLLGHLSPAGS